MPERIEGQTAPTPRPAGAAAASPCTHHYIIDADNHGVCCHCGAERDWPRLDPPYQWRDLEDAVWTAHPTRGRLVHLAAVLDAAKKATHE